MSAPRLNSIVLVGRDCELWLAVIALAQALTPAGVSITAVELPSRLAPSDIHASLPQLETLHARLGIERDELLGITGGSLSLGQNFVIGSQRPSDFFHSWGVLGRPIDGHDFLHCWLRASAAGSSVGLRNFSLPAEAARHGRILLDEDASAAVGHGGDGYHLLAIAYAACLKSLAARRGVIIRQTTALRVEQDGDGHICALALEGADRVAGELFVDASGEEALLIGGALRSTRLPWPQTFGADRVLTGLAPPFTMTPPFAEIRIGASGWTALHPTPSATGILHAFRGEITSDARAAEAASAAAGARLRHVAIRPIHSGVRNESWVGNCVAIGTAAARLDPLHDLDLHVLQLGIVHLISLFPAGETFEAERAEYNRSVRSHLERLRDFQGAFYALAPRLGKFWPDDAQSLSGTLEHTLATFRASAYLPPHEHESLLPDSWHACLLGLGLRPERWPATTDRLPASRLREEIDRMLVSIRAKVLVQPTHHAYLKTLRGHHPPLASAAALARLHA